MGRDKGRGPARRSPDAGGVEATVFEAQVDRRDGRPFVKMTSMLDGVPVFSTKMSPAVATALGLRAVQAAIEAERDAGFVAFLRSIDIEEGGAAQMLHGLRLHREQFDVASGSMAALSDEDPSELDTGDEPDEPEPDA